MLLFFFYVRNSFASHIYLTQDKIQIFFHHVISSPISLASRLTKIVSKLQDKPESKKLLFKVL